MLCSWDFQIGFTREERSILCGRVIQILVYQMADLSLALITKYFSSLPSCQMVGLHLLLPLWLGGAIYMTCSSHQALS